MAINEKGIIEDHTSWWLFAVAILVVIVSLLMLKFALYWSQTHINQPWILALIYTLGLVYIHVFLYAKLMPYNDQANIVTIKLFSNLFFFTFMAIFLHSELSKITWSVGLKIIGISFIGCIFFGSLYFYNSSTQVKLSQSPFLTCIQHVSVCAFDSVIISILLVTKFRQALSENKVEALMANLRLQKDIPFGSLIFFANA